MCVYLKIAEKRRQTINFVTRQPLYLICMNSKLLLKFFCTKGGVQNTELPTAQYNRFSIELSFDF